MTRSFFLSLLGVLSVTAAAQAQSASAQFKGQIISRETCKDGGVFSQDICKSIPLGKSRDCTVSLGTDSWGRTAIKLSSNAWVETGDVKKSSLQGKLEKPYAYAQNFVAHMVKLDSVTSAEVKLNPSQTSVLDTYVYTNHVVGKDAQGRTTRTFKQYRCSNLKRVL